MAKEKDGKLYVCMACGEEYVGKTRKWTCPLCGNADTFVEEEKMNYDSDDYLEEDDY